MAGMSWIVKGVGGSLKAKKKPIKEAKNLLNKWRKK